MLAVGEEHNEQPLLERLAIYSGRCQVGIGRHCLVHARHEVGEQAVGDALLDAQLQRQFRFALGV